jgi:hypothetical protein
LRARGRSYDKGEGKRNEHQESKKEAAHGARRIVGQLLADKMREVLP